MNFKSILIPRSIITTVLLIGLVILNSAAYGMEASVNIRNYPDVINDLLGEGYRAEDEFESLALMVLPKIEQFIIQNKKQSEPKYITLCIAYLNNCFSLRECSPDHITHMLKDRFLGNSPRAQLYALHCQQIISQLNLEKLYSVINQYNDFDSLLDWLLIFDNTQHPYERLLVEKLTALIDKQGLKVEMQPWELSFLHKGAHVQGLGKKIIDTLHVKEQANQKMSEQLRADAHRRKDQIVAILFNVLKEGKEAELDTLLQSELVGDDAPLGEYKEYINTQIQERIDKNKLIKNGPALLHLWQNKFNALSVQVKPEQVPIESAPIINAPQECAICCDLKTNLLECIHCEQAYCKSCAENWIGVDFTYTTNFQDPQVIHKWKARNDSCPYCRQRITSEQLQQMIDAAQNEDVTETNVMQKAIKKANLKLLRAAQTGKIAKIKQLIIEAIADLNAWDDDQDTPLILAVKKGYKDIIECLIKANVNLNSINKYGNSALIFACNRDSTTIALALIQAGADVNIVDKDGDTALLCAVKNKNADVVKALVNAKANVNICNKEGEPLLKLAVKSNNVEIVKALLDGSTQKNNALLTAANTCYTYSDDRYGYANKRNLEIVNLLIEAGANVNIHNPYHCTPLIFACDEDSTAIALALIQAGADVNMVDVDGDTALLCAVKHKNADVVKALVNAKANVNICNKEGEPLLKLAVKSNNVEIVKALLDGSTQKDDALLLAAYTCYTYSDDKYGYEYANKRNLEIVNLLINAGANVNVHGSDKYTPLIFACAKDSTAIALALIQAGADVNMVDVDGDTALLCAVKHKNADVVKALVNAKANVNICNKEGEPLLKLAVKSNNVEIVKALLDGSTQKDDALLLAANTCYTYSDDKYGYEYANKRNLEIVNLLINAGANVNVHGSDKYTPLIFACAKNSTAIALALIQAGADVNMVDVDGDTALLCAVKHKNADVVKALVNAKANVNICNKEGEPLLKLAVKSNNVEIVKALLDGSTQKDDALLLAAYTCYTYSDDKYGYEYANKRNLEIVNLLINAGANVNVHGSDKYTPLIFACAKDSTAIALALIQAGADVNMVDVDGDTALLCAVKHKNADVVKALVNAKANVNICNKEGEPLLKLAVKSNNVEIVKALLDGSTQKDDALLLAAYTCYTYSDDKYGYEYANKRNLEIVNLLINAGANVNVCSTTQHTPLILACEKNSTAIALALIEAGANVNMVDRGGDIVLLCAVKHKNAELVKALVNAKANIPNAWSTKVLELAIQSKYPDLPIKVINPMQKSLARKSIEILLMIYRNAYSCLSELPQEVLKIIITCAYPEYAMDHQTIACLHPQVLVDTVPLETLSALIKNGVLQQETIFSAWKEKLMNITQELKRSNQLRDERIQSFATDALNAIEASLR